MKRLAVLALLAAGVWAALTFWPANAPEQDEASNASWPSPKLDTLKRITMDSGEGVFSLVPDKDGWRVETADAAVSPRADEARIRALIDHLEHSKPKRDLGPLKAEEAASFGLEKPRCRLALENSEYFEITLGLDNPTGDGAYALSSAAPGAVLLVDSGYVAQLSRAAAYFYDTRLLNAEADKVSRASVEDAYGPVWAVAREGEGFVFTAPESLLKYRVSAPQTRFYLHNLLSMKADALLPDVPDVAGRPILTVRVAADGREHALRVFALPDKEGVYVGNSTWQPGFFQLAPDKLGRLAEPAFNLRERTVLSLDMGKVARFTITQGNQTLTAVKNDGGWKAEDGKKDLTGIDMSLWRLTDLKFEAEPAENLPDTAESAVAWTLEDKDGNELVRAAFYSDPALGGNLCWLKPGGGKLYPVSNQLLKDLQGQLPSGK